MQPIKKQVYWSQVGITIYCELVGHSEIIVIHRTFSDLVMVLPCSKSLKEGMGEHYLHVITQIWLTSWGQGSFPSLSLGLVSYQQIIVTWLFIPSGETDRMFVCIEAMTMY